MTPIGGRTLKLLLVALDPEELIEQLLLRNMTDTLAAAAPDEAKLRAGNPLALYGRNGGVKPSTADDDARRAIRADPAFSAAVDLVWDTCHTTQHKAIPQGEYAELQLRVIKSLLPLFDLDDAVVAAAAVTEADADMAAGVSRASLLSALHRLADLWVEGGAAADYAAFVVWLLGNVTAPTMPKASRCLAYRHLNASCGVLCDLADFPQEFKDRLADLDDVYPRFMVEDASWAAATALLPPLAAHEAKEDEPEMAPPEERASLLAAGALLRARTGLSAQALVYELPKGAPRMAAALSSAYVLGYEQKEARKSLAGVSSAKLGGGNRSAPGATAVDAYSASARRPDGAPRLLITGLPHSGKRTLAAGMAAAAGLVDATPPQSSSAEEAAAHFAAKAGSAAAQFGGWVCASHALPAGAADVGSAVLNLELSEAQVYKDLCCEFLKKSLLFTP